MVDIDLEFSVLDSKVTLENVNYTPLWVDETLGAGPKTYRVINVEKALANSHQKDDDLLDIRDYEKMSEFDSLVENIFKTI